MNYMGLHVFNNYMYLRASLVAQMAKNRLQCGRPSDGKESTCSVGDLGLIPGLGDPLEKEKATHSSILAWRISWTV